MTPGESRITNGRHNSWSGANQTGTAPRTLATPFAIYKFVCIATEPTSCLMWDACRKSTRSDPHPESTKHRRSVETPAGADLLRTDRAAALMKQTSQKDVSPHRNVVPASGSIFQSRPMSVGGRYTVSALNTLPA